MEDLRDLWEHDPDYPTTCGVSYCANAARACVCYGCVRFYS